MQMAIYKENFSFIVNLIIYFVCSITSLDQISPKVEYSTSLKHMYLEEIINLPVLESHSDDHSAFRNLE